MYIYVISILNKTGLDHRDFGRYMCQHCWLQVNRQLDNEIRQGVRQYWPREVSAISGRWQGKQYWLGEISTDNVCQMTSYWSILTQRPVGRTAANDEEVWLSRPSVLYGQKCPVVSGTFTNLLARLARLHWSERLKTQQGVSTEVWCH